MLCALDPALLTNLRQTLLATEYFRNDNVLVALFVDARIAPWRYLCREASNASERVNFLIDMLCNAQAANGESVLVLFLKVIRDQYSPENVLYSKLKQLIQSVGDALQDHESPAIHIPFVNRESEFDRITQDTHQMQYWLIYAPQGYGKTTFLNKLNQHYRDKNWVCVQLQIPRDYPPTLHPLIETIIQVLGETITFDRKVTPEKMGVALARCISRRPVPGKRKKLVETRGSGVVLELDNVDALADDALEDLAVVIGSTYKALCEEGGVFFKNDHRFCFLLSSRESGPVMEAFKRHRIYLVDRGLSPYSYKHVQETIRHYMNQVGIPLPLPEEDIEKIASQLMYYGGGHPGCIATLLTELAHDCFVGYNDILAARDRITQPVLDVLRDFEAGLPDHALLPILENLSVFRRIDYALLKYLVEQKLIPWNETAMKLDMQLSATHLTRDEEAALKDSITQRLLLIRFRTTQPAEFAGLCRAGLDFYQKRLSGRNPYPASDALEYLYLRIHEACHVNGKSAYDVECVFVEQLQLVTEWFADVWGPDDALRLTYQLGQKLIADWELEFLTNYFLSPEHYQPTLFSDIVTHFNQQHPAIPAARLRNAESG